MNTTVLENRILALSDELRLLRMGTKDNVRLDFKENDVLRVKSNFVLINDDEVGAMETLYEGSPLKFSYYAVKGKYACAILTQQRQEHCITVNIPLSAFETMVRFGILEKE